MCQDLRKKLLPCNISSVAVFALFFNGFLLLLGFGPFLVDVVCTTCSVSWFPINMAPSDSAFEMMNMNTNVSIRKLEVEFVTKIDKRGLLQG